MKMRSQSLLLADVKWCCRCDYFVPKELFSKNRANFGGLAAWCKACTRIYDKESRDRNKDERNRKLREHRARTRDARLAKAREPEERNKAAIRQQRFHKRHWKVDINYTLRRSMSNRINSALKHGYTPKNASTLTYLGCDIVYLKHHLESQFFDTMSWETWGDTWEIDHILPCASFDLSSEDERKQCFHFSNLRPLPKLENRLKSSFLADGTYVNRRIS